MPTAPMVSYDESVTHQLGVLARAVNRTPGRTRLYLLAGGMVLVIVATAAMQVRLNAWNQPFYDAIERRDLPSSSASSASSSRSPASSSCSTWRRPAPTS